MKFILAERLHQHTDPKRVLLNLDHAVEICCGYSDGVRISTLDGYYRADLTFEEMMLVVDAARTPHIVQSQKPEGHNA